MDPEVTKHFPPFGSRYTDLASLPTTNNVGQHLTYLILTTPRREINLDEYQERGAPWMPFYDEKWVALRLKEMRNDGEYEIIGHKVMPMLSHYEWIVKMRGRSHFTLSNLCLQTMLKHGVVLEDVEGIVPDEVLDKFKGFAQK